MKLTSACFLIIVAIVIIATPSYSTPFYDDKKFSDILITNDKFVSEWTAVPESQIPPRLKPLTVTKGNIDGKTICLVPIKLLLFDNNGTFTYLWKIDSSNTGEISGKWRLENSTLIFILGKNYSSVYQKGSELRYKVSKALTSNVPLKYSGINYPRIPSIIKTTNDPLKDFAKIVISMEKESIKSL